jgi:hypothetical protein
VEVKKPKTENGKIGKKGEKGEKGKRRFVL